jgi:hypothetical protein
LFGDSDFIPTPPKTLPDQFPRRASRLERKLSETKLLSKTLCHPDELVFVGFGLADDVYPRGGLLFCQHRWRDGSAAPFHLWPGSSEDLPHDMEGCHHSGQYPRRAGLSSLRDTPEVYALEVVDHELPQSFGRMLCVEPPCCGKPREVRFLEIWPNWPIFRNCGASR